MGAVARQQIDLPEPGHRFGDGIACIPRKNIAPVAHAIDHFTRIASRN